MPNRMTAFLYGVLAGGVTQRMAALTFITVGMLRASIASTERVFPFIIGGSLLAATSGWRRWCFFVSFDIKLAALYALGVASVLSISGRVVRFRSLGALMFGLALIMESAGGFPLLYI